MRERKYVIPLVLASVLVVLALGAAVAAASSSTTANGGTTVAVTGSSSTTVPQTQTTSTSPTQTTGTSPSQTTATGSMPTNADILSTAQGIASAEGDPSASIQYVTSTNAVATAAVTADGKGMPGTFPVVVIVLQGSFTGDALTRNNPSIHGSTVIAVINATNAVPSEFEVLKNTYHPNLAALGVVTTAQSGTNAGGS